MLSKAKKLLILITAVAAATATAFADADLSQDLELSILPSITVTKTQGVESGTINSSTGTHSGLYAKYAIFANDDKYKLILSATTIAESGSVNALGDNGRLLFANLDHIPTKTAVDNARSGSGQNHNVIAYPVNMSVTKHMTANFKTSDPIYGYCWEILFTEENDGSQGTLIQTIGSSPCSGTYELGGDIQGQYQATVTLTIVAK